MFNCIKFILPPKLLVAACKWRPFTIYSFEATDEKNVPSEFRIEATRVISRQKLFKKLLVLLNNEYLKVEVYMCCLYSYLL